MASRAPVSRQGNLFPALHTESDISLHKFPNHESFALENFRPSCEFLANQCGSSSVIDDGGQGTPELHGEMRDESGGCGLITLIDSEKAISKDQHRRMRIVLIRLAIIFLNDLMAEHIFRRVLFLHARCLDHLGDVAASFGHHSLEIVIG